MSEKHHRYIYKIIEQNDDFWLIIFLFSSMSQHLLNSIQGKLQVRAWIPFIVVLIIDFFVGVRLDEEFRTGTNPTFSIR
jgi:hypothetical protein